MNIAKLFRELGDKAFFLIIIGLLSAIMIITYLIYDNSKNKQTINLIDYVDETTISKEIQQVQE